MKLPIYFMVLLFVAVSCEGCRGHLVHFLFEFRRENDDLLM